MTATLINYMCYYFYMFPIAFIITQKTFEIIKDSIRVEILDFLTVYSIAEDI
jgi:hypothetical protein